MSETHLEFEKPIQELENKIADLEEHSRKNDIDLSEEIQRLRERLKQKKKETYENLTSWQRVQIARNADRPVVKDYISLIFDDFMELHGDRTYRDDPALITGFARLNGRSLMLIGHRKGKNTKERMDCNFGSPHPEGYRKALHKMKLAEKFQLPILCLINTPGAYPGIGAEERGQAQAIADNLFEMSRLETPIISIVIGEGGSGGALGIGIGDILATMEHSYYSVISPEGCAAILWKDGSKAPEAAEALKLIPEDLKELGIVDDIISEPLGGAHRNPEKAAEHLKDSILSYLDKLSNQKMDSILEQRYEKYRNIGEFLERED